jgi:hypothetical protein
MSDIDWSSLQHAYGSARNIPRLLDAARTSPVKRSYDDEPWFTLWSSLYHQDDIYSASFAAVPELVAIARERSDGGDLDCLTLAASIELRRNQPRAPRVPPALLDSYRQAVADAGSLANEIYATRVLSERDSGALEIIRAVFRGDYVQALRLLGDDENVQPSPFDV